MDKLYAFNKNLDQSRFNLSLGVFKWACALIGRLEPEFEASKDLWFKYILAWVESLASNGSFVWRETYLKEWQHSAYDLTWFSKKFKGPMDAALRSLAATKPPVPGDPAEFLEKLKRDAYSEEEFARVGPAMAMHYLIAHEAKAKADKEEREEEERIAAKAAQDASEARLKELRNTDCDLEEMNLEFSDEDEMDVDDGSVPPPEGVDLTRVPWDEPWMRALLNIDTGIVGPNPGERPKSGRTPWIGDQEGHDLLTMKPEVKDEEMEEDGEDQSASLLTDIFAVLSLSR